MKSRRTLPLLLVVSGLLSLIFLFNAPPGYGPDEPSHFGYVRYLAEGHGFPVLGRDNDPSGPSYESHQPPLYYLLAIPFYRVGLAAGGEHGAWIAARLFTLICGLLTVAGVYALMRMLFPEEPVLAAGAGALAGWLPSQAWLFSVVSNDPLTELGFVSTLLLLTRYLLRERQGRRDPLWIGLATGAAFLAKYSALTLFVAVGIAIFVSIDSREKPALRLHGRALALYGAGALVCVPWLIRNQMLYGDPLGWGAFVHYFQFVKKSPTPMTFLPPGMSYSPARYFLETVLPWGFRDSLGMWLFQPPGRPIPQRISFASTMPFAYPLWGLLWLGAAAGCVRFLLAEWKGKSSEWKTAVLASVATLALLFTAYLRLNAVFFWAHSRYVFPAVAGLALIWSVGLSRLAPGRARAGLLWGVSGFLFLLGLYAGYALLGGYFDSLRG
jgi:hypothetical protein